MEIFKNKFFIICLCVAVAICGFSSAFAVMGYYNLARGAINVVTFPVRIVVSGISDSANGFYKYFQSVNAMEKKNEQLQKENEQLNREAADSMAKQAEIDRLRSYLQISQPNLGFSFLEGMIISREAGNYMTVFTVNKGSASGVELNMPVITGDGIVGSVSEVGLTYCKITTILENSSSVGACIERSGATGIVSGDYSMRADGYCKLSYLSVDADVEIGDRVFSSGIGSVYPPDLLIGTVEEITIDEFSRNKVAKIKPAADLSDLRYLLIVTEYPSQSTEKG